VTDMNDKVNAALMTAWAYSSLPWQQIYILILNI